MVRNRTASGYRISLKELPEEKKPREKLIRYGPDVLRIPELVSIILNTGYRAENVLELSHRVIKEYGSRAIASEKNVGRLMETLGIPPVKACQIIACFELGRRFFQEEPGKMPTIRGPEDVYIYLEDMRKLKKEQFRGLYLNARNKVIHDEVISIGTLTANLVHPREVFQPAIEYLACGVIVAHNHPSGDPEPSEDDLEITRKLASVGKTMDIELLDHIIIGRNKYVSLKEKGILL
jgi:DNA repair protein RadC